MTVSQYRRLFLVLILPLLVAGAAFTKFVIRPSNYITILCESALNCYTTDGLGGKRHEELMSKYPEWFSVHTRSYEKTRFLMTFQ